MEDKLIALSIEQIEPAASAHQRMYENIIEKAEKKTAFNKERPSFIKRFIPLAACVCIIALGAYLLLPFFNSNIDKGASPTQKGTAPSDAVTTDSNGLVLQEPAENRAAGIYENIEAVDDFEALDFSLNAPEGAENVEYYVIEDNIPLIDFEVDSYFYFLMGTETEYDFSGISGDILNKQELDVHPNALLYTIYSSPDTYLMVEWIDDEIQYYLYSYDDISEEDILSLYTLILEGTN